jgi:choline kinase
MDKLTLVILAAGLGSRFGGMKQVAEVGPHSEFIIDYSLYDAQKAGFERVIFVIKEEHYEVFKETIGSRVSKDLQVEYAFQKMDDLPEGITCPAGRVKPRGTGHAILATRNLIDGPFGVITADDFYGRDAFVKLVRALREQQTKKEIDKTDYCLIGYQIKNTMSKHGTVKRGICEAEDGYLVRLGDSIISEDEGIIIATPINGETPFEIRPDHLTSMLMFGFNPTIFPLTSESFAEFLREHSDQLETIEYIHSDAL